MRVINLDINGIVPAKADLISAYPFGEIFFLYHGKMDSEGKGGVVYPLSAMDFAKKEDFPVFVKDDEERKVYCPRCGELSLDYDIGKKCYNCQIEISTLSLEDVDLNLVDLNVTDKTGNERYLLTKANEADGRLLVLWDLDLGENKAVTYEVEGDVKILGVGYRKGDGIHLPCPVLSVTGPCVLTWGHSTGTEDQKKKWTATFDSIEGWVINQGMA